MVFLSTRMKIRRGEKYISNVIPENDRALYRFWSTSEAWRPRAPLPNPLHPFFSFFNSHFESPPSTIFHGKQYRFRYLPNNSESFSSVSSYERGEGTEEGKKKERGSEKSKREVEERERERRRKKGKRRKVYQTRGGRKREADIYTAVTWNTLKPFVYAI